MHLSRRRSWRRSSRSASRGSAGRRLLQELIFGGLVLSARDDLVIDASDDVRYDAAVGGDGWWLRQGWDLQRRSRREPSPGTESWVAAPVPAQRTGCRCRMERTKAAMGCWSLS